MGVNVLNAAVVYHTHARHVCGLHVNSCMQELADQAIKHKHRELIQPRSRARTALQSMTEPLVVFVQECSVATREAIARAPQQGPRLIFLKEYVRDTHQLQLHDAVLALPDMPMDMLLAEAFGATADNGLPNKFLAWEEVCPFCHPHSASSAWVPA